MRVRARVAALTVVTLSLLGFGPAADAATQVGFKAHSYAGFNAESSGGAITGQKPESKLWIHDGKWWAAMLSPAKAGAHTIWRLDPGGWTDTGVVIDTRAATKEDVLSMGQTLYIASRWSTGGGTNMLRRYTYANGTYTLDSGFPVPIPGAGQETLTIARDSLGTLWITFERAKKIFVAHTLGSDTSWSAEFVIPVQGANGVISDDISSVIAFTDATGPAIGIMWTNQNASADYFAVHRDGAPVTSWTVETALSGPLESDDHISLKAAEGRVFAAVKTDKFQSPGETLIRLLVRSPSGVWSIHHVATLGENHTRPIAMLDLDPAKRLVYVFMTAGEGASARRIVYKASQIDSISFPSTATTFIQGPNNEIINDATSTKQNTNGTTGIVILASDTSSYWWNKLGGGTPSSPPSAVGGSASTNEDISVNITLNGNDPDTCELIFSTAMSPAHGSLGAVTEQGCATGSPNTDRASIAYTPAADYSGPDSFTFLVNDGTTSSSPATISITVNAVNDAPTAASASTTTAQNTPVTVTLMGSDPETCELMFAATTPQHGSLGALTPQACSAGSPNVDRASVVYTPNAGYTGPDSFTFTVKDTTLTSPPATISITVSATAPGITFRSASSAANPTSSSLTLPVPAGVSPGDVMLATVNVRGGARMFAPAAWTLVRRDVSTEFVIRQEVYVRVAASEPASYTWTFSASQAAAGGIVAYSGVDTTSPVNAHGGQVTYPGGTTSIVAPSITTTVNGALIVGFFGMASNTTITPPPGMTERFDVASIAGPFQITSEGADVLQPTAGATGSKTATAQATGASVGQLIALKPAGV